MTSVEQVDVGLGHVAEVREGTVHDEERIVAPPNDQSRRLALSEPGLPHLVLLEIGAIVEGEVELGLDAVAAVEVGLVKEPALRCDPNPAAVASSEVLRPGWPPRAGVR